MVGPRTIRATLPARRPRRARAPARRDDGRAARRGGRAPLRRLRRRDPRAARRGSRDARDIEIAGAGLEEAFLELTRDDDQEEAA